MSNNNNPVIHITADDLPLYCTGPQHETWNGHPRICLPIQSDSHYECPYCGTVYQLNGKVPEYH